MHWWVELAHHDVLELVGRRVALGTEPLALGRASAVYGAGTLDHKHVSRTHAVVELEHGVPVVRDCGSHNGTFVNGTRVERQPLAAGDVIGLGRVLLLLSREPTPPQVPHPEGVVGVSHALMSVMGAVRDAALRGPTLLWGESGVGKTTLARVLHDASDRPGALELLTCGASDPSALLRAGCGSGDPARRDTVVLDHVEDLTAQEQRTLLGVLLDPQQTASGVVACSVQSPEVLTSRLRPELAHRLCRWPIRVAPLRERRPDIMPLALAFARRFEGAPVQGLSPELSYRLLRHRWPGNLHELEAVIERATVEANGGPLRVFDALDGILAQEATPRMISTIGGTIASRPYVIDAAGRWFMAPDGERHDLERRKTLGRVLAALVESRCEAPGRALGVVDLLERAWPDESLPARAGSNRVYVAVTTLRKLGLRDLLVRSERGYVLDPDVPVEVAR